MEALVYPDALFREKRKKGRFRFVVPPRLEASVADTHAHVHLLADPVRSVARAALWNISFICNIVDVCEDDLEVFREIRLWPEAARALVPALREESYAALAAALAAAHGNQGVCHVPEGADFASLMPPDGEVAIPHMRIAVGCHPHNARLFDEEAEARLRNLLADEYVCAVGEVGLDYHYDFSPRDVQREVFRRQIRIAHETGLPLALHVREAHDDAFAILQEEGFGEAGVLLHCFDLGWDTLAPWIEAGSYVAFGGALTFKRSDDTRTALARAPRSRLLSETDAPYMTPEPMRGMPCEPAHSIFSAACMADVCGCEPGAARAGFLRSLVANARRLLDRPPTAWQLAHGASDSGLGNGGFGTSDLGNSGLGNGGFGNSGLGNSGGSGGAA